MPQPRKHADNARRQAAYRAHRAQRQALSGVRVKPRRAAKAPRLPDKPGARRWELLLAQAQRIVELVADEMQEYHDERSDKWQQDERGEAFTERLEAVQEVTTAFDNIPES